MLKVGSVIGLGGCASVIAFNSSEYWRMARNIQRGKLFLPDRKNHLDPALCPFPLADVRNAINTANSFCGRWTKGNRKNKHARVDLKGTTKCCIREDEGEWKCMPCVV